MKMFQRLKSPDFILEHPKNGGCKPTNISQKSLQTAKNHLPSPHCHGRATAAPHLNDAIEHHLQDLQRLGHLAFSHETPMVI